MIHYQQLCQCCNLVLEMKIYKIRKTKKISKFLLKFNIKINLFKKTTIFNKFIIINSIIKKILFLNKT